jgi:hypothetical protein
VSGLPLAACCGAAGDASVALRTFGLLAYAACYDDLDATLVHLLVNVLGTSIVMQCVQQTLQFMSAPLKADEYGS